MIAIRVLCILIAAGGCLLQPSLTTESLSSSSASPPTMSGRVVLHYAEIRTGKIVLYGPAWGDWTCPATEKCGIAARQGVKLQPGEWCVAAWYETDLNRTGILVLSGQMIPARVCDHADPLDLPRIQELGIAVEIPYPLAATIPGMIHDGWVTGTLILISLPASSGPKIAGCTRPMWMPVRPRPR